MLTWAPLCRFQGVYRDLQEVNAVCRLYSKFKGEVVISAMTAYKKTLGLGETRHSTTDQKPRREWEGKNERSKKKTNWFKRRGNLSVMFLPATPKLELKNEYERCIRKSGLGIKVIERSGRMINYIVQKSDPFSKNKCEDQENCMMCKDDNSKG